MTAKTKKPKAAQLIRAYLFTYWECPKCELNHEKEGDHDGEKFKCDYCGTLVKLERLG